MYKLISHDLWKHISKLAAKANTRQIAVAYVSKGDAIEFGEGDVLICDASDYVIASGQTSATVLRKAFKNGTQVYSLPSLHAKLFYLGGTAVIGSPNISNSSERNLIEAALITDHPQVIQQVLNLIEELKNQSDTIDKQFLIRIAKIPVTRRFGTGQRNTQKPRRKPKPQEYRAWIVGEYDYKNMPKKQSDLLDAGVSEAQQLVSHSLSTVDWVRLRGKSDFSRLAKQGDTVIYLYRKSQELKQPQYVFKHAPILMSKRFEGFQGVYTEVFKDAWETTITWRKFLKLAKQVGIRFPISINADRKITQAQSNTLFELWDTV